MTDGEPFDPAAYGFGADPLARLQLESREETVQLGRALASESRPGDVFGLIGPLGSGKTTLVGGMADQLDAPRPATSPTYTLVNRYDSEPPLIHVDLYRLETVGDLETTGYWDYLRADEFVVCVEWLDRVPEAWPGSGWVVGLSHRDDGRDAVIWASDPLTERAEAMLETFGGWP